MGLRDRAWRTEFLNKMKSCELTFDPICGFGTELFLNFEALECKFFQKFVISGKIKVGS